MTQVLAPSTQKSTIVRMFSAPWPVRSLFWLLERVAPRAGARWAERIWFTLPRPREHAAIASGRNADGDSPRTGGTPFTVNVDGHDVVGRTWGGGPAVYLVHGWAGNRGQLMPFVAPLVDRGFMVVAFDAPSHGASAPGAYGPRSSTIPEFATALARVSALYGPAHAIVAHSMGATATAVALCDGLPAGRVVMLAPMASPLSYARQFAKVLGFGDRTFSRLVARTERRVGAPMRHFDVPELGRAIAMPPTLIIHDRDDASTAVTDGAAIAAAWPSAHLRVTSGLGHRRLLRDPGVVTNVVDFVSG